mgnify:CR=1 FL=1
MEKRNLRNKALIGALALLCIVILIVAISRQTREPEKRSVAQVDQSSTDVMEPFVVDVIRSCSAPRSVPRVG